MHVLNMHVNVYIERLYSGFLVCVPSKCEEHKSTVRIHIVFNVTLIVCLLLSLVELICSQRTAKRGSLRALLYVLEVKHIFKACM